MISKVNFYALVAVIGCATLTGCGKTSQPTGQAQTSGQEASQESASQEDSSTAVVQDPHDIPMTDTEIENLKQNLTSYTDALAKIESYRDTIREAIADDVPQEAHRPLDELDIVLKHLPTVARNNDIPKSQWETVNTSAQHIRELFNKVHAQIDDGEQADFEAVAADIETALGTLKNVQTQAVALKP